MVISLGRFYFCNFTIFSNKICSTWVLFSWFNRTCNPPTPRGRKCVIKKGWRYVSPSGSPPSDPRNFHAQGGGVRNPSTYAMGLALGGGGGSKTGGGDIGPSKCPQFTGIPLHGGQKTVGFWAHGPKCGAKRTIYPWRARNLQVFSGPVFRNSCVLQGKIRVYRALLGDSRKHCILRHFLSIMLKKPAFFKYTYPKYGAKWSKQNSNIRKTRHCWRPVLQI